LAIAWAPFDFGDLVEALIFVGFEADLDVVVVGEREYLPPLLVFPFDFAHVRIFGCH
jgi:hypothetical protein